MEYTLWPTVTRSFSRSFLTADCTELAEDRRCLRINADDVIEEASPSIAIAYNSSFCFSGTFDRISRNIVSYESTKTEMAAFIFAPEHSSFAEVSAKTSLNVFCM